jgi:cytochrome P450
VLFEPLRREFFGLGPWTGFVRSFAAFRKLVFDMIAENRARPEPGDDVFSLLVAARDEEGQALSDQEILDELMALVFAGHETTAVALAWALYDIHLQPAVLERLRDELAPLGDDPDLGELSKLPFLDAVCNETLRLHPPIPLYTRRLARDTHLLGHDLPAGTLVGTAACSTHRIASIYPDPERFDPERFVGRTYSPHEYLPWGGGVHRCLGVAFATMEMKVVIATILRRHQLKLHERGLVKLKIRPGTVGPRHGIRMALA